MSRDTYRNHHHHHTHTHHHHHHPPPPPPPPPPPGSGDGCASKKAKEKRTKNDSIEIKFWDLAGGHVELFDMHVRIAKDFKTAIAPHDGQSFMSTQSMYMQLRDEVLGDPFLMTTLAMAMYKIKTKSEQRKTRQSSKEGQEEEEEEEDEWGPDSRPPEGHPARPFWDGREAEWASPDGTMYVFMKEFETTFKAFLLAATAGFTSMYDMLLDLQPSIA